MEVLRFIRDRQEEGYGISAWNGAGFDFRLLGHAAGDLELAGRVVMEMYDPMFQILCYNGYPVSLAAASGKARANDALVSIDPVAGGTATGWSLYDAATDGNLVGGSWDLLDPATGLPYAEPVALDAGIVFGIGDLVIPLENPA